MTILRFLRPRWQPSAKYDRALAAEPAPAKVRDFQRQRVYRWEAAHILVGESPCLGLDVCRRLVEEVFRAAEGSLADDPGWCPPRVTDGRGRRHACGSRAMIKLPRWARSLPVVLHECAHGLATDGHGPDFVGCYAGLLVAFAGFKKEELVLSLDAMAVRYDPIRFCRTAALHVGGGRLRGTAPRAGC